MGLAVKVEKVRNWRWQKKLIKLNVKMNVIANKIKLNSQKYSFIYITSSNSSKLSFTFKQEETLLLLWTVVLPISAGPKLDMQKAYWVVCFSILARQITFSQTATTILLATLNKLAVMVVLSFQFSLNN